MISWPRLSLDSSSLDGTGVVSGVVPGIRDVLIKMVLGICGKIYRLAIMQPPDVLA